MIEQFFIVNKSGGMIYKHEWVAQTDINSLLVLTSTLHSLNELSRNVLLTNAHFQSVAMGRSSIHMYRTLTGTLFIFVCSAEPQGAEGLPSSTQKAFESVYRHYCDFVMGSPFYQPGMPINCSKFRPEQFLC